jgi:type II restriction enzyme
MPFRAHIKKWEDLVTSQEATRKGFVAIAFEKNIKATPFIEEAKSLKVLAEKVKTAKKLLNLKDIYPSLLTASGLSEKALSHLNDEDKKDAINQLIENFLEPAGEDFIEELVYRFLLTKGDALGGIMRNLAGILGEKKLIRGLISSFSLKGIKFKYLHKESKTWIDGNPNDLTVDEKTKGLYWEINNKKRTLLVNITPPFVSKNVDLCLFDCEYAEYKNDDGNSIHTIPEKYIALGELKGGIDPAGADEHWKTANTALGRIRSAFGKKKLNPFTFFIGAAIEKSMSQEIYNQLTSKTLTNAANLTNEKQLVSICDWINSI